MAVDTLHMSDLKFKKTLFLETRKTYPLLAPVGMGYEINMAGYLQSVFLCAYGPRQS